MSSTAGGTLQGPLQSYQILGLPPSFYYIPDFITAEEEASILQKIPAQRWVTLSHRRLQAHPSTLTKNNTLLAAPLPGYLVTPVVDRFKPLQIFKHTPHKVPNHVLINEYRRGEGIMPHQDGSAYADVVATISLGASVCLEISQKQTSGYDDAEQQLAMENSGAQDQKAHRGDVAAESKSGLATTDEARNSAPVPYKFPTRILQEPRSLLITTGTAYKDLLHGISPIEVDQDLNADTVANWALLGAPHVFHKAGGRNERATRTSLTYRDVLKVSLAANKVLGGFVK